MGIRKIESKTHMYIYHVWLYMLQKSSIEIDQAKLVKNPNALLSMGDAKKLHHLSQQQKRKETFVAFIKMLTMYKLRPTTELYSDPKYEK